MLCVLLLVFAVANKAAAYHHADHARGLVHTKVWQNNQDATSVAVPDLHLDMFFAVVMLLVLPLLLVVETRRDERVASTARWFMPALAVRPPPAY